VEYVYDIVLELNSIPIRTSSQAPWKDTMVQHCCDLQNTMLVVRDVDFVDSMRELMSMTWCNIERAWCACCQKRKLFRNLGVEQSAAHKNHATVLGVSFEQAQRVLSMLLEERVQRLGSGSA
jgi:hypothetical protein